ncbi:MAG: signal peptidase I [Phycisphaerae bacterium]
MNMQQESSEKPKKDVITESVGILEELASALVMALLIIGFVVQPFIIPTGSMAETLNGAHFRLRCEQCGYRYDTNFDPSDYGIRKNAVPSGAVVPPITRCPSCGYYNTSGKAITVSKGDKILALKGIYQFFEPKRWDVIVFKNPLNPMENYIKRLIGKPGEMVEIIDGDIFINGMIARKPLKVQQELWMLIYNSNYIPIRPYEAKFNNRSWKVPFQNYGSSSWKISEKSGVNFSVDDASDFEHRLVYDTSLGNDFRAAYAYNKAREQGYQPICSDLKVIFSVAWSDAENNLIGAGLRKYQRQYKASINSSGYMSIIQIESGKQKLLAEKKIEILNSDKKIAVSFENVDHYLLFTYGNESLGYDLGLMPTDVGPRKTEIEPEVEIIGSGNVIVSDISIYRDIAYTSVNPANGQKVGNAVEGSPFELQEDEFFVLGDNSPASYDGRWWDSPGIGNNSQQYRAGVVPRDYLIGKAFLVFWPSGFRPFDNFPIACVPNVGSVRLIYGGSEKMPVTATKP